MSGWYRRLIDNHPLANIAFALVLLGGITTYLTMPRAQDPEINFNWVNIITTLPGASAEDIERELTGPLEDAIKQVKDIKFVSSSSREGVSSLLVRFEEIGEQEFDKRVNDLRREVQNKAEAELPAEATEPVIVEITTSNGFPTAILVLYGAGGGETLRSAAFGIKKDLERLADVDQVIAVGFDEPELHVDFDPDRVAAAGLSPVQVSDSVAAWFRNTLGGRMRVQDREWLVRLEGKTPDPEVLAQAAVVTPDGRVALGEVARVARGHERTGQLVSYNGQPAVMMSITKQAGSNTLELVDRLKRFAAERNPLLLGEGVQLVMVDDQTHMTRDAIGVMESNALFGLVLVLGLCWLFLGPRLALLVGLGVPFALAGTFLLVDLIGSTLNLTVLLGVVIALGMLVDDAVVIVEAIYYRLQRGDPAEVAIVEGVREVALPVISSVLTTIAAFLPLMLLPGILGKFMFLVPFVVTAGLAVSLVEAFWMIPAHILALRPDFMQRRSRMQARREYFTHWLRVKYSRLLVRVFRRPKTALAALALVMAGAVGALAGGLVKIQFFAFDPVRLFYVSLDMPAGVTLQRTLAEAERAAQVVQQTLDPAEVRSVTAYAGIKFTDTEPLYGDQYGQVIVSLNPRRGELRNTAEVIAAVREPVLALQGEGKFSFLELKGGPPTARPISVKVKADNYEELRAAADALFAEVAKIPGVKDLTDDDVAGRAELRLVLNREKLARAGVAPGEVARLLRLYGEGEMVATTRDEGEKVEVVVRARPETLTDVGELLQRPVPLPRDAGDVRRSVQLGSLVDAETRISKGYIRHYQLTRAITIEAGLDQDEIDTLTANNRLKAAWAELQPRFPNVELDFSGELDDIQESLDSMAALFSLGVGLIYLILATQFRSYWQPLMVLVTVPLAFTGVLLGLLVSGNPLSLYTMYGVIALAGIAVNSAIVLIDAANERRVAGMTVQHAAIYAARRRVVPILITSTTTIAGLFSLAIGLGGKSLMWGPVAASIVWGLGFSTLLTLFAIPLIYRLAMGRLRRDHGVPVARLAPPRSPR
ncbi:efflux RND transporter permease subunit [Aromatoleum aromaticum]|uniref:Probable cation efflux system protein CZCA n=1 Tax=Aromatoleum aromaticum (strain DSM 19018 / LMG 30748 / EbN1) TaxID=76114 RepID=Q5P2W3_AROAE|nr:efflux RND transporter permease subunit [Aromatoleum aromaticum]NMG53420.1 AcrB/AcrD/AcrF family protein [Aromatoleum aromaticum]CAI08351.1 probable cation efflux system protein CZCA [Aromatoleum aromaticum EbN1]